MFITNVNELIETLKEKLPEYMEAKFGPEAGNTRKAFCCPFHDDSSPSMSYNPKNDYKTVRCWSGCGTFDIFTVASKVDNLPTEGPEFITETLVELSDHFDLKVQLGHISEEDRRRHRMYKLAADVAGLLEESEEAKPYLLERGWSEEHMTIGTISAEELKSSLLERGWTPADITESMMISTGTRAIVDEGFVTFTIKDYRGRPIAFISRNLTDTGVKYINSGQSLIYNKGDHLLGLDVALRTGNAKQEGIYIVEGPGDLASLHRVGIFNAAALCGTAFTGQHLALLKMIGIRKVYFSLDWDSAGTSATERILTHEVKFAPGVSCFVVQPPSEDIKDPGEYLLSETTPDGYLALQKTPGFEWVLGRISDNATPATVCEQMIPLIASETTAIRRELLIKELSEYTEISYSSIAQDVEVIRDGKEAIRRERLQAAAERYARSVSADPNNQTAAMSKHEADIERINTEFKKTSIGPTYQISRYDAQEEQKASVNTDQNMAEFKMTYHTQFAKAFSGGMSFTDGVLTYVGGYGNSGKTASIISIGADVAYSDPDAIVIMHFTDDSYSQVTPRILSTAVKLMSQGTESLPIGCAANPYRNIKEKHHWDLYNEATVVLRELLAEEKLIIIDSEDGNTLSPLEKQLQYIRSKYPTKKILVIADNTANYGDYPELDQTSRMRNISTAQKYLTTKYHCHIMATVEYRKKPPGDSAKMKLPMNDDIADARAMVYRPNVIIHVYNDLHERGDNAEIFWIDKDGRRQPRLMLVVAKNKITSFKSPEDKLFLDLDTTTVTMKEVNASIARKDANAYIEANYEND